MDIREDFEAVIAHYEEIELTHSDSLNILKEKLINNCLKSLEPIRVGEEEHVIAYINQAVTNLKGMKASTFLQMYTDFLFNIVPLMFSEEFPFPQEYIEQEATKFILRHKENILKLEISKEGLTPIEIGLFAFNSFLSLVRSPFGNLYNIIQHLHAAQDIITINKAEKNALSKNAAKANTSRHRSSQRAKELAIELWQAGNYPSKAEAARKIRPIIVARLEQEGLKPILKLPRAEKTIEGYITEWERNRKSN